jgi:uncharacterized phage-associated protein
MEKPVLPQFTFDERIAVEAILYIASKSREPTFHRIAKLLYFADLCHLERHGRFICGDRYIAMKHGPVPSGVYDILTSERDGIRYLNFPATEDAFEVTGERRYHVRPLREANLEWLSDSDIECLDESIHQYDHLSFAQLTALSHDAAWESADENDSISLEAIVQRLGNPSGLLEYLQDPNP